MNYRIDVNDLKDKIKQGKESVCFTVHDKKQIIQLAYQKTGYGEKRFFLCPYCGKRVAHLYVTDSGVLKCRVCSGIKYTGIQNMTKGGNREIEYRMIRFAQKNGIDFIFPFDYQLFSLDDRLKSKRFRKNIRIMQSLENMRFQAIFQNKRYTSKQIKTVLSGEHPLVKSEFVTLKDLRDCLYEW